MKIDNDFLDRLYAVYKDPNPLLNYRLNKIEYILPHYENIKNKINDDKNAFRSISVLIDDSEENSAGEKGPIIDGSLEGRPIYEIRHGDKKGISVFIWSQMHGTESTGTRALMDIFLFLLAEKDEMLDTGDRETARSLRSKISSLNIHFVPMANPDGANNWRRTSMQKSSGRHPALFVGGKNSFPVEDSGPEGLTPIDLNRDAWTSETREAKLLWRAFANFSRTGEEKESQPSFAFTLHDQGSTGVGGYDTPATITMLAPASNGAKYFNDSRWKATQIIQKIDDQIQSERPEMTTRYTDDWGAVYFGDSITMMGTGVILIESGCTKLDPEKVTLRRTNFKAILRGLFEIAGDYEKIDPVDWVPPKEFLSKANSSGVIPKPPSRRIIYDVLLRNVLAPNGNEYNLGINRRMNTIPFESDSKKGELEHRSLWYFSSEFSGKGSTGSFHDNLSAFKSARHEPASKVKIPYLLFNNGHGESRYSNPGNKERPNPIRYWSNIGHPANLGMTFDNVWPEEDLSFGYEELDCKKENENLKIIKAKVYDKEYDDISDITLDSAFSILREGFCAVRIKNAPDNEYYNLPLIILYGKGTLPPTINDDVNDGENNFILCDRDSEEARYAVISGYLIDLIGEPSYPVWGIMDGNQSSLPVNGLKGDEGKYIDSYPGHFRNIVRKA
ncbi:MAG: hypothetical protein FWG77_00835 [Treponema sp.]|nr:hypothetical protein [Treponema sp.]